MVRQLLMPATPKQEPSGTERQEEQQAFVVGFYEATFDLAHWAVLGDVSSQEAAALLCGINPLDDKHHRVGKDFMMLERRFSDHAKSHPERRRLADWWGLACTWKSAGRLNGITLSRDFGEALVLLDAQYQPTEAQPQAAPVMSQSQSSLGTAIRKGTQPALTGEQKTEVVKLYQCGRGVSVYKLATQFNVSRRTIDAALGAAGVKQITPRKGRSTAVKTARKPA